MATPACGVSSGKHATPKNVKSYQGELTSNISGITQV